MWKILGKGKKVRNKVFSYRCQCICGKIKDVSIYNIKNGRSKSCGCQQSRLINYDEKKIKSIKNNIKINNKGCWLWQKGKDKDGYGTCGYKGKTIRTHRLVYSLINGEIPKGKYICHSCDQPSCCNPDHLFLGDASKNSKDMTNKGRQSKGLKRWSCKLTIDDVLEIRKIRDEKKLSYLQISKKFNVAREHIYKIIKRKVWKHV